VTLAEALPILMFASLALLLFSGFPVGFVLGGLGLTFGLAGYMLDVFSLIQFSTIVSRVYGSVVANLVLVAIPMFIFMGTMLEKSGVASNLLYALQVLLRRVPGGLALSVTMMGIVMAASTGIIGASVVMMTLLALPVMVTQGYNKPLATGTIAASGTLGILIPPSIMLVIMGDLISISVGGLFLAALIPGLILSSLYMIFLLVICTFKPALAPPLETTVGPHSAMEWFKLIFGSFLPPIFLITVVLGSIFMGIATPTEAAGVGAAAAVLLAAANRMLSWAVLKEVVERSGLICGMLFLIIIGATCFSYIFRALGGEDLVLDLIRDLPLGPWAILAMLMAVVFLLGFFFDWIEITLIVLPIFAPIMLALDFGDHVGSSREVLTWFAILVAVNLQTSFLTPPFGFAIFYLQGVAPRGVRIQDVYRGVVPFVMLQVLGLGLVMAMPDLALWLPRLVLGW
jgi:tripartite ATP-independent transporter DctM subunit